MTDLAGNAAHANVDVEITPISNNKKLVISTILFQVFGKPTARI